MLEELSQLQESDETHTVTSMTVTVETWESDSGEIVERAYTFTHAEEWGQWNFSEYEEKRCNETAKVTERNWRVSRHVWWHEHEPIDVEIPQTVSNKLAERLDADTVNIQL